jgi:hypothetical protein
MVKFSGDSSILAVVSPKGDIMFLEIDYYDINKITPYCLYKSGDIINDLKWNDANDKILIACKSG